MIIRTAISDFRELQRYFQRQDGGLAEVSAVALSHIETHSGYFNALSGLLLLRTMKPG